MGDELRDAAERVRKAKEQVDYWQPRHRAAEETLEGVMREHRQARHELAAAENDLCRIARGEPPEPPKTLLDVAKEMEAKVFPKNPVLQDLEWKGPMTAEEIRASRRG